MTVTPFALESDASGPLAGVVVVRIEQPGRPVVVLDRELIQRLEATLRLLPSGCAGVVVASASERVFIAGADLKSIAELDDAELDRYLAYGQKVFGMLSQLPCPTAAAINGAALGGGFELAMHCDGLVACPAASGKPYPVGLPEAGLSICPGWGGTNLLPARMDAAEAIRLTATGRTMLVGEAHGAGVFDAFAAAPGDLIATAKRWIVEHGREVRAERDGAPSRWIGRNRYSEACRRALAACRAELTGSGPAQAVLDAIEEGLTRGWQAALDCERRRLIGLRGSPQGRAAIQAFFERSGVRS